MKEYLRPRLQYFAVAYAAAVSLQVIALMDDPLDAIVRLGIAVASATVAALITAIVLAD